MSGTGPVTDNADIAGRWDVTLTDGDGKSSRAVAVFNQRHDRVTGTVMTPTGDHRFLDGQVHGEEVQFVDVRRGACLSL